MRLPLLAATLLLLGTGHLSAQTPTPEVTSLQQIEQMKQTVQRMMNPAAMVLSHRTELGLSEAQVSALRPLADQMSTTVEQMLARQPSPAQTRLMQAIADSTVVVDEAAVRADYCAQAGRQADYTIAMVRTQRRVNGILTPAQQEKVMALEINTGMQMMQAFLGAQEKH